MKSTLTLVLLTGLLMLLTGAVSAQVAVRGKVIHTMAGPPITDGMIIIREGKIAAVGKAADLKVPEGYRVLEAAVVTPGLVDAHSVVGLSGYLNSKHDRDQLEQSTPIQPELRALDAYNPRERLVEWIRGFGVTTVHTGHAPGELITGQTIIVKTTGETVEQALVVDGAMVTATLATTARKGEKKSPGTRGKMIAMLRSKFIEAREYLKKRSSSDDKEKPARKLALDILAGVLEGKYPLLVTAHRAQDIASALRLAREFSFRLILDGAAEAYLMTEEIKAAAVPIILHPTMARANRELENLSFETASKLRKADIPFALQSGYESYVPKTRVVLFEAAIAAANGLSFDEALASITIDAARLLGVDKRVGSLVVGKDGDVALYDGDPFEYTSHCIGTVIEGVIVSERSW